MRAPMQCVIIFTPKNANAVHQNQPVRQGQVPCMYVHSVYVLRGVFV